MKGNLRSADVEQREERVLLSFSVLRSLFIASCTLLCLLFGRDVTEVEAPPVSASRSLYIPFSSSSLSDCFHLFNLPFSP